MNKAETLGARIRRLREQKGWSLRRLARQIDVSAPFLSDVEHDRRKTTKIPELAAVLGVSVATLRGVEIQPMHLTKRVERLEREVALLRRRCGRGELRLD